MTAFIPPRAVALRAFAAWTLASLGLFALPCGAASSADKIDKLDTTTERAKIATERAEIMAAFTARERECRTRFIVTSCVEAAQREQRSALDALRLRQHAIDEEQRRARAAQRREDLETKAQAEAEREKERAARAADAASAPSGRTGGRPFETPHRAVRSPGTIGPKDRPGAATHGSGIKARADGDPAERKDREERNRDTFEKRQRQAAEHRQEALANTLKRMQAKPPAKPLPLPPGAAPMQPSSVPLNGTMPNERR